MVAVLKGLRHLHVAGLHIVHVRMVKKIPDQALTYEMFRKERN